MTDLYDPDQLRTFLAVAETRSFTQAAARLGIRQSTVSTQIRKLEQATGRQLFARDTHTVTLTPDGDAMIGFANGILAAYEPAQRYFAGPQPRGRVRLGLSDDLALTRLPEILRAFRSEHPLIDLELTVDQSGSLHRRLERNQLDLFLGKRPVDGPAGGLLRRGQRGWGSAGLGVSAVAAGMVPASLVPLGGEHRLPRLGHIDVVLMANPRTQDRTQVRALSETVLTRGAQILAPD